MGTSIFAGVKQQGQGLDHCLPSSIPVLERTKLFPCCPLCHHSIDKGQLYLSTFCLIWYVITVLSSVLCNSSNVRSERSRHVGTNRMGNYVCVYPVVSLPRPANKPERQSSSRAVYELRTLHCWRTAASSQVTQTRSRVYPAQSLSAAK